MSVIRLCGPASRALPPFVDVDPVLASTITGKSKIFLISLLVAKFDNFLTGDVFMVDGGYYVDGKTFFEVNEAEIREVALKIKSSSVHNVVISGNWAFNLSLIVEHI